MSGFGLFNVFLLDVAHTQNNNVDRWFFSQGSAGGNANTRHARKTLKTKSEREMTENTPASHEEERIATPTSNSQHARRKQNKPNI